MVYDLQIIQIKGHMCRHVIVYGHLWFIQSFLTIVCMCVCNFSLLVCNNRFLGGKSFSCAWSYLTVGGKKDRSWKNPLFPVLIHIMNLRVIRHHWYLWGQLCGREGQWGLPGFWPGSSHLSTSTHRYCWLSSSMQYVLNHFTGNKPAEVAFI